MFARGANLTQSDIFAKNPSTNSVPPPKAELNESRYEEELYQMYTNMPKLVILLHGCHGISHIHETLLLFTLTSAEFIQTREAQNTLYVRHHLSYPNKNLLQFKLISEECEQVHYYNAQKQKWFIPHKSKRGTNACSWSVHSNRTSCDISNTWLFVVVLEHGANRQ